jgi:alkaline phosphatase D
MGDFIYIENPLDKGRGSGRYAERYRKIWNDDNLKPYSQTTPFYFIYDDHEIRNNWDDMLEHPFGRAQRLWDRYVGGVNPTYPAVATATQGRFFNWTNGDVGFFVLDTRRYRSHNGDPDVPGKSMIGNVQKEYLFNWLQETRGLTFRVQTMDIS